MAPIAQAPAVGNSYDGSRPRFESLQAWLKNHGNAEYGVYKRNASIPHLSYEEWAASEHVLGPYLWHTTLDVWEEDSSSDVESDLEAPTGVSRGPPERKPKKPLTTNGNGMRRATKSSISAPREKLSEAEASAKRRRKPKKKYLSEEIVASDISDDIEEPTLVAEVATPVRSTPIATANGRRKSSGRKKKQFLSEETISPEDLEDDAMSIDEVAVAAAGAQEPSPPDNKTPFATVSAGPPKSKPGRKPRKKYLSQATVPLDDEEDDSPADDVATPNTPAASPDSPGTSSTSRRGLRIRTPAQQRPYFQDARLFEDIESGDQQSKGSIKRSPRAKATKLAQVSYPEEEEETLLPPPVKDSESVQASTPELEEDEVPSGDEETTGARQREPAKRAHYKGKGRAWKKTSEDEDQDYISPLKSKSAKQPRQPKRQPGRRKSTQPPEARAEQEEEFEPKEPHEDAKPTTQSPASKAVKQKRRPRKTHHLSEEFVRDTTDTEVEAQQEPASPQLQPQPVANPAPVQKTPKPRGRPRKSDQSTNSKTTINIIDDDESLTPRSRKSTPRTKARKMRGPTISLTATPERKLEEDEEEQKQGLVSPLRSVRKRKSVGVGSDSG